MSDKSALNESPFDQERENQLVAQREAEHAAKAKAPTGLFALMLAPLLLIAIPIALLWVLRAPVAPVPTSASQSAPSVQGASAITWLTSFNEALAAAQKTGKPIMADFYADWCGPCKAMDAETWPDVSVVAEAKNVVAVKINVDAPENLSIVQRYAIRPIPCTIWMDSTGNEKGRLESAVGPQDMLAEMQKYR